MSPQPAGHPLQLQQPKANQLVEGSEAAYKEGGGGNAACEPQIALGDQKQTLPTKKWELGEHAAEKDMTEERTKMLLPVCCSPCPSWPESARHIQEDNLQGASVAGVVGHKQLL